MVLAEEFMLKSLLCGESGSRVELEDTVDEIDRSLEVRLAFLQLEAEVGTRGACVRVCMCVCVGGGSTITGFAFTHVIKCASVSRQ